MYRFLSCCCSLLSQHTPLCVILAAVVSFFFPSLFDWVVSNTQTAILGFIMLTMGLTLTKDDMLTLARRPFDLLIGTLAQFTLMPLIAWSLVHLFNLDTALAVGIILVGCCPGGVSSNLMSFLCKGDVAYSVGMTTVSTLLAPIVTPSLVLLLARQVIQVDFWGMFLNILIVTVIPVAIGFVANSMYEQNGILVKARRIMPGLSVVALAMIVGGVVSVVHDNLVAGGPSMFLWIFAIVFCHNGAGYLTGYIAGRIARFSRAKKRTLSIEVGMQNAGLATNLASTFFLSTCPLAVVPCAISCAWHTISGTLIASLFSRIDAGSDARNEGKEKNDIDRA